MKHPHGAADVQPDRKTDMVDPLTFSNLSESEELKRNQNMAKARMNYYSHNLKLRLQYARLKIEHGWQRQTLSEVENLYFRHTRLPYPATNPRKNTLARDLSFGVASGSAKSSIVVDSSNAPSTPLPSSTGTSVASMVAGTLSRSDTLHPLPDTPGIPSTQNSFQSTTLLGSSTSSMDMQPPHQPQQPSRPIPPQMTSSLHIPGPTSSKRPSPPSSHRHGISASSTEHIDIDPNIDPMLYSPALMQPPRGVPPHVQVMSMSVSGDSGLTMAAVLASSSAHAGLNRTAISPAVSPQTSASTLSLPAQSSGITTASHRSTHSAPHPLHLSSSSSSPFGSPMTYDTFWNSHQSNVGTYGFRGLGLNVAIGTDSGRRTDDGGGELASSPSDVTTLTGMSGATGSSSHFGYASVLVAASGGTPARPSA